jgi:hypothetical protein
MEETRCASRMSRPCALSPTKESRLGRDVFGGGRQEQVEEQAGALDGFPDDDLQ